MYNFERHQIQSFTQNFTKLYFIRMRELYGNSKLCTFVKVKNFNYCPNKVKNNL